MNQSLFLRIDPGGGRERKETMMTRTIIYFLLGISAISLVSLILFGSWELAIATIVIPMLGVVAFWLGCTILKK